MAGVLLDSIINDTLEKSFGGSDLLEDSLLKGLQGSAGKQLASPPPASQADQLDQLSQLLQNVEMGRHERLFWVLIFSLMVLVAAGGNTIVVYIVATNKEMKSVTNYFLVNLSLADTMVSTLNVIFNFISMLIR